MARDGTSGRRLPISNDPDHAELKDLRLRMRAARRSVSPLMRRRAALAAARRLARLPAYKRSRDVALYMCTDGELDPALVAKQAWATGKRVWLPVVGRRGRMEFALARPGATLKANRYGIPEPASFRRQRRGAGRLGFIVVPLVAFDAAGRRLGMGGGYYDRALAGTRRSFHVGLAFELQEVPRLPARAWDIPMDLIVTERRYVRPKPHIGGAES